MVWATYPATSGVWSSKAITRFRFLLRSSDKSFLVKCTFIFWSSRNALPCTSSNRPPGRNPCLTGRFNFHSFYLLGSVDFIRSVNNQTATFFITQYASCNASSGLIDHAQATFKIIPSKKKRHVSSKKTPQQTWHLIPGIAILGDSYALQINVDSFAFIPISLRWFTVSPSPQPMSRILLLFCSLASLKLWSVMLKFSGSLMPSLPPWLFSYRFDYSIVIFIANITGHRTFSVLTSVW